MAKDYDSLFAELEEADKDWDLPKGISKKAEKKARKALAKAQKHADKTKEMDEETKKEERSEKPIEAFLLDAFLKSKGNLAAFAKAYSPRFAKDANQERGLVPMQSSDAFLQYYFDAAGYNSKEPAFKEAKKELASLRKEVASSWDTVISDLLQKAQDTFASLYTTATAVDVSTDVLEMYVASAVDIALNVDLNFYRMLTITKGQVEEAVAYDQIAKAKNVQAREKWIDEKRTGALTSRRLKVLKAAAMQDIASGKSTSSKLLTTAQIKDQADIRRLIKKYSKQGITAGNYEDREEELSAREELAEMQKSWLRKKAESKVSGLKEKYLGDDSLIAKATLRKFRQGRHDKQARMLELQSRINASRRASLEPPAPTNSRDVEYQKQTREDAAARETQKTLKRIADNTRDIAKNSGNDMGIGSLITTLGAISLPALGTAIVGGLGVAITAYMAKKFGGESMPSETGNYKLEKPIKEMGAWERFSSRAGSRRQDIEEMVENGKKFTAAQASDIKKYYDIDVPVDKKAAGEKVLSYSAPPTPSNPTGASATAPQPTAADTSGANPNPKALVKAISGAAGAGYESAKSAVSKFVAPVAGRISSFWSPNRKNPVTGKVRPHKGVDFAVPVGTPVTAAGAGTVSLVNANHKDFGQVAMISHPDGTSSLYAHNSQLLVTQGQKVEAGQQIALSGNSGLSSGPHVHFEMMKGNAMGSGQFDPGSAIPSLAGGGEIGGAGATTTLASAASTVTPTSPEAPPPSAQSPVAGTPITSGSSTAVAAATGSTPKPAAGGTNVATVPTYAYMDAKFFALNLSAIT